jgi:hypothetical protein
MSPADSFREATSDQLFRSALDRLATNQDNYFTQLKCAKEVIVKVAYMIHEISKTIIVNRPMYTLGTILILFFLNKFLGSIFYFLTLSFLSFPHFLMVLWGVEFTYILLHKTERDRMKNNLEILPIKYLYQQIEGLFSTRFLDDPIQWTREVYEDTIGYGITSSIVWVSSSWNSVTSSIYNLWPFSSSSEQA